MAFDPGLAQILRENLAGLAVTEKRMMGGLCFLLDGHMMCGVHKGGAMVRVGKPNYQAALALPGVAPLGFTGRPMQGLVDVSDAALTDDDLRTRLLDMARGFVATLPAK